MPSFGMTTTKILRSGPLLVQQGGAGETIKGLSFFHINIRLTRNQRGEMVGIVGLGGEGV